MQYDDLKLFIQDRKVDLFLLDACGVLYDGLNIFSNIPETINELRKKAEIRLVTNNSSLPPHTIASNFKSYNIHIEEQEIISSGFGLYLDPKIHKLIKNKKVYIYGKKPSYFYVEQAAPHSILQELDQAEVIIFTDTLPSHEHYQTFPKLIEHLKQHKEITLICCNPDRYINYNHELMPVIGHYADEVVKHTGLKMHWVGKPYKNFSILTEKMLLEEGLLTNRENIYFFDDNFSNLKRLTRDLKIKGVLVKDTGISKNNKITNIEEYDVVNNFSL